MVKAGVESGEWWTVLTVTANRCYLAFWQFVVIDEPEYAVTDEFTQKGVYLTQLLPLHIEVSSEITNTRFQFFGQWILGACNQPELGVQFNGGNVQAINTCARHHPNKN